MAGSLAVSRQACGAQAFSAAIREVEIHTIHNEMRVEVKAIHLALGRQRLA
jgi:hypothetical protein